MHADTDQLDMRELDQRSGDGFEVTLLWSERSGSVFVCVDDQRTNTGFHFPVDPADALDAFRHPYAYGQRGGRTLPDTTEWGAAAA
jgi:hypothetical protein